jgi:ATP/maltotriose-dependent transcriptional regulator MalT
VAALVERDDELSLLLAFADAGEGRLVLLSGEAGAGKTALLGAWRERLRDRCRVMMGRCEPLAAPTPLGPLFEMLPSFPEHVAELLVGGGQPAQLFAAVLEELSTVRSVLVLDDVHFADEATVDLIRYLGRRIEDTPSVLVTAYRPGEIGRAHPFRSVLGELGRHITRIELQPLTVAGVTRLAEGTGQDPVELYRRSGGNPLFVTELLAHPGETLPASVADAVLARSHQLPRTAWDVLDAVAIAPEGLPLDVVSELAPHAGDDVDQAVGVGLLEVDEGRVRCRHDLIRMALSDNVPPARSVQLHRRLVDLLSTRPATPAGIASLAHHAVRGVLPDPAVRWSLEAARRAATAGAHRQAADHYENVLRFRDALDDARLAEVLAASSYQLYLVGRLEEASVRAADMLSTASEPAARGRALRWMSRLAWFQGRSDEAERHGRAAVAVLEAEGSDQHELAFAYSNLAQLAMLHSDGEQTRHWATRALEIARPAGDIEVIAHALNNLGSSLDEPASMHLVEESLELALRHHLGEHAARAFTNLAYQAAWRYHLSQAEDLLRRGMDYTETSDLDTWWWYMRGTRARVHVIRGRWRRAAADTEAVLATQTLPMMRHEALVAAAQLAMRTGGDHIEEAVMAAVRAGPAIGEYQRLALSAAVASEWLWRSRQESEALDAQIDEALAVALRRGDPWGAASIAYWQCRRGRPIPGGDYAEPVQLELRGDLTGAARAWAEARMTVDAAVLRAELADRDGARRAVDELVAFGATGTAEALRAHLQARGLHLPLIVTRPPEPENRAGLTNRQLEVLHCLGRGLSNADIANELYISQKTAEHHVSAVLMKLGARSRSEAVARAREHQMLSS